MPISAHKITRSFLPFAVQDLHGSIHKYQVVAIIRAQWGPASPYRTYSSMLQVCFQRENSDFTILQAYASISYK